MQRNASVIAPEMPARDQPVSAPIGSRNTASENTVPMATQVISAPAATSGQLCGAGIGATGGVEGVMASRWGGLQQRRSGLLRQTLLEEGVKVVEELRPAALVVDARLLVEETVVHEAQVGAAGGRLELDADARDALGRALERPREHQAAVR